MLLLKPVIISCYQKRTMVTYAFETEISTVSFVGEQELVVYVLDWVGGCHRDWHQKFDPS
jgi:hypothetical protein